MKKTILTIAISLFTVITFAQTTGLKITSSIPTDKGMKSNVLVRFNEFYLNKSLASQFNVGTSIADTIQVIAFADGSEIGGVYNFKLSAIPNIEIMWDSVKVRLENKGLTVVKLP